MTYSKIYQKIFWKDKINYNKIIMFTQNNLIIITLVVWSNAEPKFIVYFAWQNGL
jgi:hypothetical protein